MDSLEGNAYVLVLIMLSIGAVLTGEHIRHIDALGSPLKLCLTIVGFTISYALAYVFYIAQNLPGRALCVLVTLVDGVYEALTFAAQSTYNSLPTDVIDVEKGHGSFGMVASPAFDDLKCLGDDEDDSTSLISPRWTMLIDIEDANLPRIMCTSPSAEVLATTLAETDFFLLTVERALDTFNLSRAPAEDTTALRRNYANTPAVKLSLAPSARRRSPRSPAAVTERAPWSVPSSSRLQLKPARAQTTLPALAEDEADSPRHTTSATAPAPATANAPRGAPCPRRSQLKPAGSPIPLPALNEDEEDDLSHETPVKMLTMAPARAPRVVPLPRSTRIKPAHVHILPALVEDGDEAEVGLPCARNALSALAEVEEEDFPRTMCTRPSADALCGTSSACLADRALPTVARAVDTYNLARAPAEAIGLLERDSAAASRDSLALKPSAASILAKQGHGHSLTSGPAATSATPTVLSPPRMN